MPGGIDEAVEVTASDGLAVCGDEAEAGLQQMLMREM